MYQVGEVVERHVGGEWRNCVVVAVLGPGANPLRAFRRLVRDGLDAAWAGGPVREVRCCESVLVKSGGRCYWPKSGKVRKVALSRLGTAEHPVGVNRANAGMIADDIRAMAEHVAYIARPKVGDLLVTADGRVGVVREKHPNQTYSKRFGDRAGEWA